MTNKASNIDGIKFIGTKEMSIDEWIELPDNPFQRDTERHAKKALSRNLKTLQEIHRRVVMVIYKGKPMKTDGHTRALLWKTGLLARFADNKVIPDVYECETEEAMKALYLSIDSSYAMENPADKLHGAISYHLGNGIDCVQFRSGGVTTALKSMVAGTKRRGFQKIDIYECVDGFKKGLRFLARLNPPLNGYPAPIIAAMILTMQRDGGTAQAFWDAVINDISDKDGKKYDAVFAMDKQIKKWADAKRFQRGSSSSVTECVPRFLAIYEHWLDGNKMIESIPKETTNKWDEVLNNFSPAIAKRILDLRKKYLSELKEDNIPFKTLMEKSMEKNEVIKKKRKKRKKKAA